MNPMQAKADEEMEEILTSIRQIITEDVGESVNAHLSATPSEAEGVSNENDPKHQKRADILELTKMVQEDGSVVNLTREAEMAGDVSAVKEEIGESLDIEAIAETESAPEFSNETTVSHLKDIRDEINDPLLSEHTIAETAAAFATLTKINQGIHLVPASDQPKNVGDHTVEGLMREILRPLLKEWLDAHLPSLVKWLVTEQIEKALNQKTEDKGQRLEVRG